MSHYLGSDAPECDDVDTEGMRNKFDAVAAKYGSGLQFGFIPKVPLYPTEGKIDADQYDKYSAVGLARMHFWCVREYMFAGIWVLASMCMLGAALHYIPEKIFLIPTLLLVGSSVGRFSAYGKICNRFELVRFRRGDRYSAPRIK